MDAGSGAAPSGPPGAPRGGLRAFPSAAIGTREAAIAIAASFSSSPRIAADAFERSVAEDSSAEDSSTRRETW